MQKEKSKIKQFEDQIIEAEKRIETRMHERAGALAVAVVTVTGGLMALSSEDTRRAMSGFAIQPAYAVVEHSIRESETAHRHVRIDSVDRSMAISGE